MSTLQEIVDAYPNSFPLVEKGDDEYRINKVMATDIMFDDGTTMGLTDTGWSVVITADAADEAPKWLDSGPMIVHAKNTDPTKPTTTIVDRLLYKFVDANEIQFRWEYYATAMTGSNKGDGDYRFDIMSNIPDGYEIDLDVVTVSVVVFVEEFSAPHMQNRVGSCTMSNGSSLAQGGVHVYDKDHVRFSYINTSNQGMAHDYFYNLAVCESYTANFSVPVKLSV